MLARFHPYLSYKSSSSIKTKTSHVRENGVNQSKDERDGWQGADAGGDEAHFREFQDDACVGGTRHARVHARANGSRVRALAL